MFIFTISYAVRFIYDNYWGKNSGEEVKSYLFAVTTVLTILVFDMIPISLILYIHSRNFKTISFIGNGKQIDESDDSEVNSTLISYDFGREQGDSKPESSLEALI